MSNTDEAIAKTIEKLSAVVDAHAGEAIALGGKVLQPGRDRALPAGTAAPDGAGLRLPRRANAGGVVGRRPRRDLQPRRGRSAGHHLRRGRQADLRGTSPGARRRRS